jgi:hypothetical protein
MSEPVVEPDHFASSGRGLAAALAALSIYFGLVLVPEWWPGFGGTVAFFLYVLTVPVVLLGLLALLLWGITGAIRAMHRGSPVSRRHRALVVLSLAGFLMFGSAIGLARVIQGALPTGSHLLELDSVIWQDPRSSEFVQGDITPRQKMLGSVVDRLEPTQDRVKIEALLGPSLNTPYFESTGRDLIYILGPQRDSFFPVDSEWLLIWLDDSGHFERYGINTD